MKTFDDLVFRSREDMVGGVQAIMEFDNGHRISVVGGGIYSHGDGVDTFEIWRSVDDDVKYFLNNNQITEEMIELQNLPLGTPRSKYGF